MAQEYNIKDVSVAQRQIHILSLLSSNPRGFTVGEILDLLKKWDIDVSRRTIIRDIDELSESYCISEEDRDGKEYFMADRYNLANIDLTVSDMISLSFLKELLITYENTDIGKNATEIINKIMANTATINRLHLNEIKKTIKISDSQKNKNADVNMEIEKLVRSSLEKRCKINILYHSFVEDKDTARTIHPYAIVFIDGYLAVEAYCELRKSVRIFRISRIKNVELTDKKYDIPSDYYKGDDNKFIHIGGDIKQVIQVEFTGAAARYVREYESYMADKIIEIDDGIIFQKETAVTSEVKKWILGYGKDAKIIKPESLKLDIIEELGLIIEKYN